MYEIGGQRNVDSIPDLARGTTTGKLHPHL